MNFGAGHWVVTAQERELFDQIFITLDTDRDGFIVGTDDCVRKIFLKTELVHTILAHIWNLCDVQQNGKLNSEQFALAMHLVNEAKKGVELPKALTPEMIPPSLRPRAPIQKQDSLKFQEPNQFSNKELEMLAKELETEKHNLEHEVTQQETHMKLKESEIKSIRNEIETMLQMIKQLENQKVEASKRLDDMENQTVILRQQNEELRAKSEVEEAELKVKKDEFEGLKSEEQQYETQVNALKKEIEAISSEIAESQLLVSKYKTKTIDLEEYEIHLNEENKEFDICIASKDVHRLNALIAKQLQPPEGVNQFKQADGFTDGEFPSFADGFAADPFAGEDPLANENAGGMKQEEDLFANDAFASAFGKSSTDDFNDDPFSARNTGFNESTPELPPKKKAGPPPRPAPPKTSKPQPKADPWVNADTSNDPFAGASTQPGAGFANFDNFANFDQTSIPSSDLFSTASSTKSTTTKGHLANAINNSNDSDPFANFNSSQGSGASSRFDNNRFETNWSTGFTSTTPLKNQEDDLFDPFAPVAKASPIQHQFGGDPDDDKKRKEKQIRDDFELALRLSKGEPATKATSGFLKRNF